MHMYIRIYKKMHVWYGITGNVCIGIECDKEIANGNNGTFNGTKYFDCPPGKGTFVVPARIRVIVKKAIHVDRFQSRGRSGMKSPPPKNRSQSTRGGKVLNVNKKLELQKSTSVPKKQGVVNPPEVSLDIPKDATPKEIVDILLSCLSTITSALQLRLEAIDKYKYIVSEDEKVSPEDVKYAIAEFKNPMQTQLRDQDVSVHEKVFDVIVAMAKYYPDAFNGSTVFYIKKMMVHLSKKNTKSVIACEKAIVEVIKVMADPRKLVAGFAASVQDKSSVVRKQAFVFLKSILERYVATKSETKMGSDLTKTTLASASASALALASTTALAPVATPQNGNDTIVAVSAENKESKESTEKSSDLPSPTRLGAGAGAGTGTPAKETLDLMTEALKVGLKDKDKIVLMEAMECANLLSTINESRSEALVSNMPPQFRKTYQLKYGGAASSLQKAVSNPTISDAKSLQFLIIVGCV
ncbi:hypothetical protein RFI_20789 [Reticulomyxa filosa]|uniref:CAP-Gly domain-containing protein n=1 Tax=Reticulomyxa filosa TaxID=46433 RepID=X6MRV1_RETFI|nr:hypothetical protein RFI_20789 [Reticulomyxa filosa]|eukprot:ETO16549.1 hypothetical protein RFI_20789 [Reticulomyxa filosa]